MGLMFNIKNPKPNTLNPPEAGLRGLGFRACVRALGFSRPFVCHEHGYCCEPAHWYRQYSVHFCYQYAYPYDECLTPALVV